jgi:hypothetical protein
VSGLAEALDPLLSPRLAAQYFFIRSPTALRWAADMCGDDGVGEWWAHRHQTPRIGSFWRHWTRSFGVRGRRVADGLKFQGNLCQACLGTSEGIAADVGR